MTNQKLLSFTRKAFFTWLSILGCSLLMASSHREAPLIANDPLADNTDLYAFRSPDNPDMITIIANYIPGQLAYGGPNYYSFSPDVRYEIHIDNDAGNPGDEIIYRFHFFQENEDPTTFFNIRLGAQNLKTSYTLERSIDGGMTWLGIVEGGPVPPANIGPRSIESAIGLNTTYENLIQSAILTTDSGENVFCGPADDPFFVDLGGIFDLGNSLRQGEKPRDGLAFYNVHSIAIQIPITTLLKAGAATTPSSILDPDYVIGVWASASRKSICTLNTDGSSPGTDGEWVQISRIGMPLTNEAVIPVGQKDYWNAISPYDEITEQTLDGFFYNPELALYMDDSQFGGAVPAFKPLRIQRNSLGAFDFGNGQDGLYALKGSDAVTGTALDDAVFGTLLLPGPGLPRSVDLWPTFHTGVPNVIPYQLATGKEGNPLAAGKPFIHNFLPNGGDMLRLNMAVPPTDRDDPAFSSLGVIQAAVLGLLDPAYNQSTDLQFIPNMDGFPNGRRLEDDVTRIELQAVAGAVLAAVGLWYDDYNGDSPVTEDLLDVLSYSTGVEQNDKAFRTQFPYIASPWAGSEVSVDGDGFNAVNTPPAQGANLYVSYTANPGIGIFQPALSDMGNPSRSIATEQAAGNGIFVDEASNTLFQLSLATATIKVYENASTTGMNAAPVAVFTDPQITSGREIAYSKNKDLLYVASNTDSMILVYKNPASLSGMVSANRILKLNGEPWGISLDDAQDRLFVAKDKTSAFQVYNNISTKNGSINPTHEVAIDGVNRTHGIHYAAAQDLLIVTEIGAASGGDFAVDGGLYVFENVNAMLMSNPMTATASGVIMGTMTLLGNPVDVDYNHGTHSIIVAEKTKGGSILFFNRSDSGNVAPVVARSYNDVPEDLYYSTSTNSIYISNAANPGVGIFDKGFYTYLAPGSGISSQQADGNGIAHDSNTKYTIQLSRATKTVKVFDKNGLTVAAFTDAAITSGREIAYDAGNAVLYVASNSDSTVLVYDNPYELSGAVSANRVMKLNGEPWGISIDAENDRLFVAKDKTNKFQVYNTASTLDGTISPDNEIGIDGAVRTHGITYRADGDVLVVTEINAASGGNFNMDGGYYLMMDVNNLLNSGATTVTPTRTVIGAATRMGNPVDVALDTRASGMFVYIAEKTNGGKLLIFDAMAEGNVAPVLAIRNPSIPEDIFLDTSGVILP